MAFVDAQVRQEVGQRLGYHRCAAVCMERPLATGDALLVTTFGDQLLCQVG
jgi:hypothetical protein